MKNNEIENECYKFSEFVLDPNRRELKRSGQDIELQPRVFDLLLHLLKHHDRAIDKNELQDAVWPGLVVTETALTRAVMKARKAIGDDAQAQKVIRTIHGHGYRFVAEVELLARNELTETSPTRTTGPTLGGQVMDMPAEAVEVQSTGSGSNEPRREFRWILPLALVLILLSMALFIGRNSGSVENNGDMRLAVLPLVNGTGDAEFDWTRLGLMSLASGMLAEEGELLLVPDGSVVSLAENFGWNGEIADSANSDLLERLRQALGSTHQLTMTLLRDSGNLRMNYNLIGPDERAQAGTMVGSDAAALTRGVVQSVYGLLLGKSHLGTDIPTVSADPFNNEAFARGMSLSLQGRCSEALPFFRLIADQETSLFAPRYELASCLRILGEVEEAETLLASLVSEQRRLGESKYLAQALMVQGVLFNRTGRLEQAEASHREALRVAQSLPEKDHQLNARIMQNLSIVLEDRNDWSGSMEWLDLAMLEYQSAGLEILPGTVYSAYANLKMDQGELIEAEQYLDLAIKAFRDVGDRRHEAMMLNNSGYLRRQQGRWDEAEAFFLQALALRQEIGDQVGVGRTYGMLGGVHQSKGEYAEAQQSLTAALEIARESQDRLYEGAALAQLGDVFRALGEFETARQYYQDGRDVFASIQDGMRVMQSDIKLARMDLESGDREAATTVSEQVLAAAVAAKLMQPEIEAIELQGDIALEQSDPDAAAERYGAALERVRQSSWTSKESDLLCKLSALFIQQDLLDQAAPLVGALSRQEDSICSLKVRARFVFASGDASAALKLMQSARQLAAERWSDADEADMQAYRKQAGEAP